MLFLLLLLVWISSYLGNVISFEGELDIDNKLNNFFKLQVF
jgi:hypothetical protein